MNSRETIWINPYHPWPMADMRLATRPAWTLANTLHLAESERIIPAADDVTTIARRIKEIAREEDEAKRILEAERSKEEAALKRR